MNGRIAVVVPTIRLECFAAFEKAWDELFKRHRVLLFCVRDGERPALRITDYADGGTWLPGPRIDPELQDLLCNFSPAIRNLGFAAIAAHFPEVDTIVSLDDDVLPCFDTLQNHLDRLNRPAAVDWTATCSWRARGLPLAPPRRRVLLSHGVWRGVPDLDALTQLAWEASGRPDATFPNVAIPAGQCFPMSGMNVAFRRELLPWMYFAPVKLLPGAERFDDIWCGLHVKQAIDRRQAVAWTGAATVIHQRASNTFHNLIHEAVGIAVNEHLYAHLDDPAWFRDCPTLPANLRPAVVAWLADYAAKRERWQELITA